MMRMVMMDTSQPPFLVDFLAQRRSAYPDSVASNQHETAAE